MRWSPRIVTVAGIPIRVNWTFAGLLLLVVAVDASSGAGAVVSALVWLVLLFGSVVVHELAHSLVARRRGLRVRDIVLLPIGGVSEIEDIDRTPADELHVAIVGPLTSLGLAGVLAAVGALAGHPPWPPGLTTGPLEDQMAWVNLLLAGFNLLPALPMDGGRVLRSALVPRLGEEQATAAAARLATVLAVLMIVGGLLYDFWVAFIGVFVLIGARSEEQAGTVHRALGDRQVGDLTVRGVLVLPEHVTVGEAAALNRDHPWWGVVVVGPTGYVGLVPPEHLAGTAPGTPLGSAADRRVPLLDAADRLYPTAVEAFARSRAKQLPVATGGRIVGLVELDDIARLVRRASPASRGR